LEEIGQKYEIVYCSIVRRAGGTSDPNNAHPEKRVPALVHDGQLVTEQAAIPNRVKTAAIIICEINRNDFVVIA